MEKKKKIRKPSEIPSPGKFPEIESPADPDELNIPVEDPGIIPDEEPFITPPDEIPPPVEGP